MESIKDRVVLLVGVADEVGEAIALRFAAGGAKLAIADADQAKVDKLISKIKESGTQATGIVADHTDAAAVEKAVADVAGNLGRIDILVNNVDDTVGGDISDTSYDILKTLIENNLNSAFIFSKAVIAKMKEQKYGRIINLGSLECIGESGMSGYAASKAAVFGLTRSLALEVGNYDITVNYVIKGNVSKSGLSEAQVEALEASLPVQKIGKPEDVAMAVGFFASDASSYMTGQTFFVCGGKSLYSSMTV